MMKLYFNPQSRAVIAKWMLDECAAQYEIVPIDFAKREHKTPEFLKINPAGKLPALVDDETKVFEGAAICLYLADKFSQANLAPKIGAPERGRLSVVDGLLDLATRTGFERRAPRWTDVAAARLDRLRDR
jgi:glutathione S-transferase